MSENQGERMPAGIRVVLAAEHPIVVQGIRATLTATEDMVMVADTHPTADLCAACRHHRATILVLDIDRLALGLTETLAPMQRECPDTAIVVLSAAIDRAALRVARSIGVSAYLLKTDDMEQFVTAIRTVAHGARWYTRDTLTKPIAAPVASYSTWGLTPREVEVLQTLAEGFSNQQIADRLCVSVYTVRNHTVSIYKKIGVRSRTAVMVWTLAHQLTDETA